MCVCVCVCVCVCYNSVVRERLCYNIAGILALQPGIEPLPSELGSPGTQVSRLLQEVLTTGPPGRSSKEF